jgi:hypothetical protein
MKKSGWMVLAAALVVGLLWSAGSPRPSGDSQVWVTNFPELQKVGGTVSVDNFPRFGVQVKREDVVVPPLQRNDLDDSVQAAAVDTGGFSKAVLCLQGEMKGGGFRPGFVGAVLVPDEEPVVRALREARRIEFPLETAARMESGDGAYFDSGPVEVALAFPRYRVYFYNTTGRGASVNLYLYLSN